mmetsp:Transcript_14105/g.24840  ORF Transcript_14105/g.24840 Transcript_14105/m.24840 type:complete len:446 (+) Transcript_14105:410-1747(+)|eukprot:CAMPEP_0184988050 /NCGR_PEP_ID=MMETSP1098-20130426/22759_1 /TAXON_ID=89044 /ORGANISM="Spumella elongata, Strain CCAP 955/1" /LENGTH=445 /DNA_ID=CAMNT_0027512709 /DNA_START=410 /DNA_END=1747 /DNA_ORIENTATION=+
MFVYQPANATPLFRTSYQQKIRVLAGAVLYLELCGDAVELDASFVVHVHLAVHEAVLGLTEGQVLVVSGGRGAQNALQERHTTPASKEEQRENAIHIVVLLRHRQVVASDAVGVPAGSHTHTRGSHVLDAVPPPGRVEQHITGIESGVVDGAVVEQREGFSVEVVRPQAHEHTRGTAQQAHRVAEEGVIGVHEEPILLAINHVEHVPVGSVVERGAGALTAHEKLLVASLHVQVRLQALVLEQISDLGELVEELLGVVQIDFGVVHFLELARSAIDLSGGQVNLLLTVLAQHRVPAEFLQQLGVLHEATQHHGVRAHGEGLEEGLGIAIAPIVFWNGHLALSRSVALGLHLVNQAVGGPVVELANQPHDAGVAEDKVQDACELSAPGSEEPAKEKQTLGEEVIVRAILGSPRRGISGNGCQHTLEAKPVGEVVSDADTNVQHRGQ